MTDTDVRDVIANALLWEEGSEWADGSTRAVKDADAVLMALAEAGLVVVPAEDVRAGAEVIERLLIRNVAEKGDLVVADLLRAALRVTGETSDE